ncbi:Uncharacterized protein ACO02O_03615 [Dirofilaria immitis]
MLKLVEQRSLPPSITTITHHQNAVIDDDIGGGQMDGKDVIARNITLFLSVLLLAKDGQYSTDFLNCRRINFIFKNYVT